MKSHIIIKLHQPISASFPYWERLLHDKRAIPKSLHPAVDRVLSRYRNEPFWVTHNYRPHGAQWDNRELASGFHRIYRLILRGDQQIAPGLLSDLAQLPQVEQVRAGEVAQANIPATQFAEAASLSSRYRKNTMGLQEAHRYSKGHPSIRIAVLDTGFEMDHPEISDALLPGKDFVDIIDGAKQFIGDFLGIDDLPEDEVGHGTHVTGILVGRGRQMPIGVVPNCKVIPIKVLGAMQRNGKVVGAGLVDNIDNGIKWAVDQGAHIINMSLGLRNSGGGLPHEEVIRYALSKGVSVVAASGNDGQMDRYYPGALPGVIAVGASDEQGFVAPFSTFGAHVSVTAPGVNIYSSFLNKGYTASSGTSQAAPFVAGAIALLKSVAHRLDHHLLDHQVKNLLKQTSDKVSARYKDMRAGFGNINLPDAIKLLQYSLVKKMPYA